MIVSECAYMWVSKWGRENCESDLSEALTGAFVLYSEDGWWVRFLSMAWCVASSLCLSTVPCTRYPSLMSCSLWGNKKPVVPWITKKPRKCMCVCTVGHWTNIREVLPISHTMGATGQQFLFTIVENWIHKPSVLFVVLSFEQYCITLPLYFLQTVNKVFNQTV